MPQTCTERKCIKDAVRERDGHRCTQCGMTADEHRARYGKTLDVHRLVPGSLYGEDGTITVCKDCHRLLPRRAKGQPDLALGSRRRPKILRLPGMLRPAIEGVRREQGLPTLNGTVLILIEDALRALGELPPAEEVEE